jgi:protein-tyrosine phosphatase
VSEPFRILVICTGNICRSPLAERLLQSRLSDNFSVGSAGTHGWNGAEMDPLAAEELRRLGGDPAGFRSRPMRGIDIVNAGLVLTATKAHRSAALMEEPSALHRTFTLRELAWLAPRTEATRVTELVARASTGRSATDLDEYDIPDPYGGPAQRHRQVADIILASIGPVADALQRVSRGAQARS